MNHGDEKQQPTESLLHVSPYKKYFTYVFVLDLYRLYASDVFLAPFYK